MLSFFSFITVFTGVPVVIVAISLGVDFKSYKNEH